MTLFHPKHKKFAIICGMDKTMVAITRLKVYLESTISSYYVALPSSSAVNAERQAYTIKWHETWSGKCDLFVSKYVVEENAKGDPVRAKARLEYDRIAMMIDVDESVVTPLADRLIRPDAIPATERLDADHVATAAAYGMDVLLTWNCTHINNPIMLPSIITQVALAGYKCPQIMTPREFLEVYNAIL